MQPPVFSTIIPRQEPAHVFAEALGFPLSVVNAPSPSDVLIAEHEIRLGIELYPSDTHIYLEECQKLREYAKKLLKEKEDELIKHCIMGITVESFPDVTTNCLVTRVRVWGREVPINPTELREDALGSWSPPMSTVFAGCAVSPLSLGGDTP